MNGFSAIIVAAGRGTRMKGPIPKQYRTLGDSYVLTHSIRRFLAHRDIEEVICVIHPNDAAHYATAIGGIENIKLRPPVYGGKTRGQSVYAGLRVATKPHVLIHDGARALLNADCLNRLIPAILTQADGAFLALRAVDSLWRDQHNGLTPIARDQLWHAQTPQGFRRKALIDAYKDAPDHLSDEVGLATHAGLRPIPIMGDAQNFKITYEQDLARARAALGQNMGHNMDIRVGTGFDIHAFGKGDHVILNGVKIKHPHALMGHSDADVAMHAITDALYGALGDGDIGQHFPPSDPQWKGQDSALFLRHACKRATHAKFEISNIDCTIICEAPKIAPHADAMRQNLGAICAIDTARINIKATTGEGLGFIGRDEGIAAQAAIILVRS